MSRARLSGGAVVAWLVLAGCMPQGEVLVAQHPHSVQVAVDTSHVYWTEPGQVWRVPRGGGNPELLGTFSGSPVGVAANGVQVAWLFEDQGRRGTLVMRALAGTGDPVVVADGIDRATALVMDAQHVFWTAASDGNPSGDLLALEGRVMAAPLAGGDAVPVITGMRRPYQLFISGAYLYVAFQDQVARAALAGGPQEVVLQPVLHSVLSVAVGDHVVYWHEYDGSQAKANRLVWAPIGAGAEGRLQLLVTAVDKVSMTAVGDTLYFASPGAVWRMETTDTAPTLLAASGKDLTLLPARGFVVDQGRAYWASNEGLTTVELP